MNPRRAPQGVGLSHAADERADLRSDRWAAGPMLPALPGPDEPEAGALPADDGLGLDDGDDLCPAVPEAGEQEVRTRMSMAAIIPGDRPDGQW